ncbi:unnamed protein product [Protopolystoma xenopodis]|uniref:Uncharacterized protein n=1 Tax=Protopolystoma xenopodis TaxID=117903 RepID=A0A448XKX1_9PLAT|nr:unnamed protein product [Protopolystoma xenopodis]
MDEYRSYCLIFSPIYQTSTPPDLKGYYLHQYGVRLEPYPGVPVKKRVSKADVCPIQQSSLRLCGSRENKKAHRCYSTCEPPLLSSLIAGWQTTIAKEASSSNHLLQLPQQPMAGAKRNKNTLVEPIAQCRISRPRSQADVSHTLGPTTSPASGSTPASQPELMSSVSETPRSVRSSPFGWRFCKGQGAVSLARSSFISPWGEEQREEHVISAVADGCNSREELQPLKTEESKTSTLVSEIPAKTTAQSISTSISSLAPNSLRRLVARYRVSSPTE